MLRIITNNLSLLLSKNFLLEGEIDRETNLFNESFETKGIEEALISLIEITLSRNNLETSNNIPY